MVANHWSDDGMVTIHRSGLGRVLDGVQAIHIFSNIFEAGRYVVVRLLHARVESKNGGGNLTHELKLRG